jgi:hypothetical protein
MTSHTPINTWILAIATVRASHVRSIRIQLFRSVSISFTVQELNGIHLVISLGVWRIELALTFELWDKATS